MSLTSFIRDNEVKAKLNNLFPLPQIETNKRILAQPVSNRYPLVGTAFDYLLRFYLEKINKNTIVSAWVSELVPPMVKDDKKLHKVSTKIVCKAKLDYYDYLESGKLTRSLLSSAILLAQLDFIYRSGEVAEELGTVHYEDIKDLKKLISIVNPRIFKAKKTCILNPTFGEASMLVNGADADVILDDMLIDIKTTKFFRVQRQAYNQLIGYYILYLLGGIDETSKKYKINKLGLYFSRHAELIAFPVKSIKSIRGFTSLIKWFKKKAREQTIYF